MTTRHAACSCGQLKVHARGEPIRVSVCHCFACQRRTGSVFGMQARFARENISIEGTAKQWVRIADSGNEYTQNFCPECGATVYFFLNSAPEVVAVAVGAFADPDFPEPKFSVYEERKHSWVRMPANAESQY